LIWIIRISGFIMKFLKHIATAFYKSCYDVTWLASNREKLGSALAYFFIFFFLVVVIGGYLFVRDLPSQALVYWNEVTENAPDVAVSVQDGTLSISGLEQPYRQIFESTEGDAMLLYVDTVTTSSVSIEDARGDVVDEIPTLVLTSKLIKVYDQDLKNVQTEYIKNVPSFSVTRQQVSDKLTTFFQGAMPWILLAIALVITGFLGMWKLFFLGIMSWLVYVVARADKKPITYWQVFTIGVYALTVPTIVQLIMLLMVFPVPYVYSIILLGFMFGALFYGMKKMPQQPPMSDIQLPKSPQEKK